jgi:hypothetical protein
MLFLQKKSTITWRDSAIVPKNGNENVDDLTAHIEFISSFFNSV